MSIAVGQRAARSLTLTAEHVRKFAEISGDHNPLHFDAAFAARTKFGRLVVQGGLTTGLLHALVATDMPGPDTVSCRSGGVTTRSCWRARHGAIRSLIRVRSAFSAYA